MRSLSFVLSAAAVSLALFGALPSSAKTVKECNAEYAANKSAIQGVQKKADFIAACRAGTETIPGGAAAAPEAAPAPTPTAAPAPAPIQMAPKPMAPAAPITASESQAQARCPGGLVVWVNTKSHVYHFKGTHNYGTTKQGTYACEADAKASGDRAAENEKHP